ncbi:ABC transporter ATP-binding protein [Mumia zhuanghuii]|uniref:ABC transporter ATP-binding protein n=1 Tax=Mumia zhuanghuii TaxID=2585211 RepID=UPI00362E535F
MTRRILPIASRRDTTRLAWALLRQRRGPLITSAAAFALAGALGLVAPWVLGDLVDVISDGDGDRTTVLRGAAVIAAAGLGAGLSAGVAIAALGHAVIPALARLREEVVARALDLEPDRLEEAGRGDVLARVGDDVRTVSTSLDEGVPMTIDALVAIGFTAVGLSALDWRLGLAGLCAIPVYALGLRWYLPHSGPRYRAERVAEGERAEALLTGLQSASTLRALRYEDAWRGQIETRSWQAATVAIDVFHLLTRFFARSNRAELIGLLMVLGTGFFLVRGDLATVGAATTAALFFHRLFNPIGGLLATFDQVQAAGASLARLAGLALLPASAAASPPVTATRPALDLAAIHHQYGEGDEILHDVSLHVAPGEKVALVGATGAGKSTLALIAAGHLVPSRGSRTLDGTSYDDMGAQDVRARVALVTQQVHVFAGTVRDNLTLAAPEATADAVQDVLERTRANGWVAALPDGLDTVVGAHGHALTPAQAQQIALARVLLADRPVVVLDEATAEAGSSGARQLDDAAAEVLRGRTSLVVAHRLSQAVTADRIVVLDHGKVAEEGTHQELLAFGGQYATLWSSWSRA